MKQDELIKRIVKKLNTHELAIVVIILALVLLKWYKISGTAPLIIAGISLICMIYYFSSFEKIECDNMSQRFIIKLTGLASALVLVGVLFAMFQWPNSKMMLIVGTIGLAGSLIGSKVTNLNSTSYYTQYKTFRIIVLIGLSVFYLL